MQKNKQASEVEETEQIVEPEVILDDDEGAELPEFSEGDVTDDEINELPDLVDETGALPVEISDETMPVLRDAFRSHGYTADPNADPLTVYLAQIRNHPILSSESQQKLAVRYKKNNDIEAGQMLVLTNLRLVVKIAREYKRRWSNLLDLIQEGNVGLSEAIRRYDPYRHVKFTSYAQYWIRAMILNYLMNHFQPIRIGSTRAGRKLFYNLRKARAELQHEGIVNPTPALVAEKLGVSEQDVIDVSKHLDQPALSIDQNAPGYENTTVGELLRDDESANPETIVADDDFYEKVRDAAEAFSSTLRDPRELALWSRRIYTMDPVTLSELGAEFNVSKERIRQIEARLKEKFKNFMAQQIDDVQSFIDV